MPPFTDGILMDTQLHGKLLLANVFLFPKSLQDISKGGVPTFFPPKIPAKAPGYSGRGPNNADSPGAKPQSKRYARPFSLKE